MRKSLDIKLERIAANPACEDFILADAKDADMAFGLSSPGRDRDGRQRTLNDYHQLIRENVAQGLIDIMLMSASTSEVLTIGERLFEGSAITPACRANDTTDIHLPTGGNYGEQPSRPFCSATIEQMMFGRVHPAPNEPMRGADLGLYSVTFNNDLERDLEALEHYRAFRIEAEEKGFRHFWEVFNPNACGGHCPSDIARYLNDLIARTLAGAVGKGRPIFLKIPYHGPAAMEALCSYDSNLVVGILGGASGTAMDAFHQLWEARKYGARAALYGRMINASEHQRTMIEHLRLLADGQLTDPADAVRSYHAALKKLNIAPWRSLEQDLQRTPRDAAYSGSGAGPAKKATLAAAVTDTPSNASDKVRATLAKWDQILG